MSSAHDLFERGVAAVRQKDRAAGQKLLRAALKENPNNEMAWVWLAKTVDDPEKQIKMLERALIVNPGNKQVIAIRNELVRRLHGDTGEEPARIVTAEVATTAQPAKQSRYDDKSSNLKTTRDKLTTEENILCNDLIQKGNAALNHGDEEGAIGFWLQVLDIQADHPGVFPLIIRQLLQMDFPDDAKELAERAISAGSPEAGVADVYLRLIRRSRDAIEVDNAYRKLAAMPHIRPEIKLAMIEEYGRTKHPSQTFNLTKISADAHPDNQAILLRLAQLYQVALDEGSSQEVYQRIAAIDHRTEEGKFADKQLVNTTLPITDRERGSVVLAVREAVGVVVLYFLLAWQDVGLSLFRMDIQHGFGTILSLIGAYLVVTGSSSHQQIGLTKILGGEVNSESDSDLPTLDEFTRYALMAIGAVVLLISFYLVFSNAIELLINPVAPTDIPTVEEILADFEEQTG